MEKELHYNNAKVWQLAGFAANNAATNALYLIIMFFFMVYCTEIYGFSPVTVGLILTLTRLLDAFTDPIIGLMVDKTNTKLGRFRPWIIAGSIVLNISFFFMFGGFKFGSDTANLVFIIVMYIFWVLGYTFQTSISKSAQTILTDNPKQRTLLNAISSVYTMGLYVFALSALFPILTSLGGVASSEAWRYLASIFIGIQVVLSIMAVAGIWEKDKPKYYHMATQTVKVKYKDYISMFKDNRALQMLIVAASTNKLAGLVFSGMTVFFYAYVVKNQAMQSTITPIVIPASVLAAIIITILTNKYGRKEIFKATSIAAVIAGVAAIILLPIAPSSVVMLVVVVGVIQFLNSGADLNVIPMIGDAVDYENYTKGRFIPGMISTAFSFIDKIISSLGSAMNGLLLSMLGFVSLTETEPSTKLFWGILLMFFLVPALGHLASVIAMKWYPLDKDFQHEMTATLHERNKGLDGA